jgi:hypothetical protein
MLPLPGMFSFFPSDLTTISSCKVSISERTITFNSLAVPNVANYATLREIEGTAQP